MMTYVVFEMTAPNPSLGIDKQLFTTGAQEIVLTQRYRTVKH